MQEIGHHSLDNVTCCDLSKYIMQKKSTCTIDFSSDNSILPMTWEKKLRNAQFGVYRMEAKVGNLDWSFQLNSPEKIVRVKGSVNHFPSGNINEMFGP